VEHAVGPDRGGDQPARILQIAERSFVRSTLARNPFAFTIANQRPDSHSSFLEFRQHVASILAGRSNHENSHGQLLLGDKWKEEIIFPYFRVEAEKARGDASGSVIGERFQGGIAGVKLSG
jgi:hypothetical protein